MRRLLVHLFLISGAILLLFPLVWMVIVAFKVPGKGWDLTLWPPQWEETEWQLTPKREEKAERPWLIVEFHPHLYPEFSPIRQVDLVPQSRQETSPLPLKPHGPVWRTLLSHLPQGDFPYQFLINRRHKVSDRANPRRTSQGASLVTLRTGGNTNTQTLWDRTFWEGEHLVFSFANTLPVEVILEDGRTLRLQQGERKKVRVSAAQVRYRLRRKLSWREGLAKLYTWENFQKVWASPHFPFGQFFWNSLVVSFGTATLTVLFSLLGGYALARKDFWGKEVLYYSFLATLLVPGMIFMVPQFALVVSWKGMNTYWAMIVPHTANVFGLLLFRQHIQSIPSSLFDAAQLDGANELQVLRHIVLPMCAPVMTALFLITFVGQWGNFLWQLIVNTPDSPKRTLPVGLALLRGQYGQDWELVMAGACLSLLPIALLFLFAQRYFMQGLRSGAVKG